MTAEEEAPRASQAQQTQWREVEVIGVTDRPRVDASMLGVDATATFELADDAIPPHSWETGGMWFVSVRFTDFEQAGGDPGECLSELLDGPDEPMTAIIYLGTIAETEVRVRAEFFGGVLNRFLVEVTL
jgi:hypothetical protein